MTFDPEHMQQTQEDVSAQIPQTDAPMEENDGVSIAAVACRAAFWTVVAVVLLFGCFVSFFPYTAMRMYTTLDNKKMALFSAEKYMARHPQEGVPDGMGKYTDALYAALADSIYLLDESISADSDNKSTAYGYNSESTKYYAQKVDKYASEYLAYNNAPSFGVRTSKIDAYNLLHSSAVLHPYLYSYADYLQVAQFKAWTILNKTEQINVRVNAATTGWNQATTTWTPSETDFLIFAQFTAYIDVELGRLGLNGRIRENNGYLRPADIQGEVYLFGNEKPFDVFIADSGEFTRVYDDVVYRYDAFVDFLRENDSKYIVNGAEEDVNKQLQYTYYLKTLSDYSQSMLNLAALLSSNRALFDSEFENALWNMYDAGSDESWYAIQTVQHVHIGGVGTADSATVGDWYKGMLTDYLKFFAPAAA